VGFVLGRAAPAPAPAPGAARADAKGLEARAEPGYEGQGKEAGRSDTLHTQGDARYLSERLGHGTVCDLTGRPREIEVQYHCATGGVDRIAWIREVTTCRYLMVVHTPRLCGDVAFKAEGKGEAREIVCREVREGDGAAGEIAATREGAETGGREEAEVVVGGTVVGAGKWVKPGTLRGPKGWGFAGLAAGKGSADKAKSKAGVGAGGGASPEGLARLATDADADIQILAQGGGEEWEMMRDEDLRRVEVERTVVEQLVAELRNAAAGRKWSLALVEGPGVEGGREIRGVVDAEDGEVEGEGDEAAVAEGELEWAWDVLEDMMFGGKGGVGKDKGKGKETWEEVKERVKKIAENVERQRKDEEKGAERQAGEEQGQDQDQDQEHEGSEETFFAPRDEL